MATQFFHKFLSIFYRQPTKREDQHSFRTVNRVFGDWATSAREDLPPPYTDSPKGKTHFQHVRHSPPPPFVCPRLQVCPHETLSIEDLQEIINPQTIGKTIDALTLSCYKHRVQSDPVADNAKNVCISSPGLLRGFGVYASKDSQDPAHTPAVVLRFYWDLGFLDSIRGQVETAAELQNFLGADGIWLCPHKRISDSDVVNAIFGFVKRPSGQDVITECDCCDTEIKISVRMEGDDKTCRVAMKRYLGTLEKPDDPVWLAQCGV